MFDGAAASDPMPLATAMGLGLLLLATGVLLLVVALRARSGTLPRNWIVGIRTRTTLADDEAWQRAHLAGATPLLLGSVGTMLAGVVLLLRPTNGFGLAVVIAGLAWLLFWVIRGGIAGQRAAKDAE